MRTVLTFKLPEDASFACLISQEHVRRKVLAVDASVMVLCTLFFCWGYRFGGWPWRPTDAALLAGGLTLAALCLYWIGMGSWRTDRIAFLADRIGKIATSQVQEIAFQQGAALCLAISDRNRYWLLFPIEKPQQQLKIRVSAYPHLQECIEAAIGSENG